MRGIFGLIALVLALAVVGVLAVKQLRSNPAVPEALPRAGEASAPAAMPAASLPAQVGRELDQLMQNRPRQLDEGQ
ncbi:MAG: hypothetical protein HZB72_06775 [Burkholderiales bacterium]|nr:hypothetical protein [Burkholderiales bacterium]